VVGAGVVVGTWEARPAGDPSHEAQNWILSRFAAEAEAAGSRIRGVV
jgi:hypothetical protein